MLFYKFNANPALGEILDYSPQISIVLVNCRKLAGVLSCDGEADKEFKKSLADNPKEALD
jgi:hypothetical protein